MKWILLTAVLLPCYSYAQEVKPVLSPDYLSMIELQRDSLQRLLIDSSNDFRKASLQIRKPQYVGSTLQLTKHGEEGTFYFKQPLPKTLVIAGSYVFSFEGQAPNKSARLQDDFVQGRSVNGAIRWQGPETGELFSYGPSRQQLRYDGVPYAYDRRGRLIAATSADGIPVTENENRVLRTGYRLSQLFSLQSNYRVNDYPVASLGLKVNHDDVRTIIQQNNNQALQLAVDGEWKIKTTTLTANLEATNLRLSNSNRTGLLNRIYKNSLLAPVDFDSRQEKRFADGQRTWSPGADNVFFLLDNPEQGWRQQTRSGSFSIKQRFLRYRGTVSLVHSFRRYDEHSREGFERSTAFFSDGFSADRTTSNREYNTRLKTEVNYFRISRWLRGLASLQYWHSATSSFINTGVGNTYRYDRRTNQVMEDLSFHFEREKGMTTVAFSNHFYGSTTARHTQWFLPALALHHEIKSGKGNLVIIQAAYSRYVHELPITQSFAGSYLLQFPVAEAGAWFPRYEVNGYRQLSLIHHREWTVGSEYQFRKGHHLQVNWNNRYTTNDIFPMAGPGFIQLTNLVNHRYQALELEAGVVLMKTANWDWKNEITWTKNFSRVLSISNGNEGTAIAGFKDVYKAIVSGKPLGVLVGSTWKRDTQGKRIIGVDGFPVVNDQPGIIGNPLPQFVANWNNQLRWRKFFATLDMQWSCGGDVWSGTQAVLDYYGRSATSGQQRSITGYVFPGVTDNGEVNNKPIDFYNPALPFEQNRWVRYGVAGVAEDYIRDASTLRIQRFSINWKKTYHKPISSLTFGVYMGGLVVWSASRVTDPVQLLFDYPGTNGLDYFNLPSSCSFGISTSIQF